jgi:hypothetical protein
LKVGAGAGAGAEKNSFGSATLSNVSHLLNSPDLTYTKIWDNCSYNETEEPAPIKRTVYVVYELETKGIKFMLNQSKTNLTNLTV